MKVLELLLTPEKLDNPGDQLIFFQGYVIWEGKMYVDDAFHPLLEEHLARGSILDLIPSYNGNFILAFWLKGTCHVANDRWGIYPVYYWKSEREIRFSTDWKWVAEKSTGKYKTNALVESLAFGHVLDQGTLLEDVFELSPASVISVSARDPMHLEEELYWKLDFGFKRGSLRRLTRDFSELWNRQLDIYLDYIRSRGEACLLPLSGGLDSRILLNEIDKRGIPSYAFTYGSGQECYEVSAASRVVSLQKHCRDHQIVTLNQENISGFMDDPSMFDLISCCRSGQKEIFYYQGSRDKARYFMPGFSGDFMAGSHLKFRMTFWNSREDVIAYILKHKVSPIIRSQPDYPEKYEPLLRELLRASVEEDTGPMPAFIRWVLANRQRKYIVRPEATMKREGTVLFLPFFDYELMDFFWDLPLRHLFSTRLYVEAMHRHLFNNNPALLSVERGDKVQKPIFNGIWEEYRTKFGNVRKKNNGGRNRIWEAGIDWKGLIASRQLPPDLEGLHINYDLDGSYLFYLLNIALFHEELRGS
jgi:asparagine synthase (glutamine-hydrolysing)